MGHLPGMGHQAIPFSVSYAESWPSPYAAYFMKPPADPRQAHLRDIRPTPFNALRFLDRSIYSIEAKRHLNRLIDYVGGVDIAYLLNIYNYMSPSIIHTLKKRGIPVVMQLGDYHLLCPSYAFLRDGRPCTLCIEGQYYHGLCYRCIKNRIIPSAIRVLAMYIQKWIKIYRQVDAFVVPCEFMQARLVEGGFPAQKIHLLHYPVGPVDAKKAPKREKDYLLYFGRISYEKGLDTLIAAFQQLSPPLELILIGRSYDGEKTRLQKMIRPEFSERIRFLGFMSPENLNSWIAGALMSVVPSRWYDNAPISVYESFLHQTPVVGADIGGITEQIKDRVTGRLFKPDSKTDLARALEWMLADRKRLAKMGRTARVNTLRDQSIETHCRRLIELFKGLMHPESARS